MSNRGTRTVLGTALLAVMALILVPDTALAAVSGTATLTGGTLSMVTPTTVGFTATLTGADQSVSASQALDILDNTGSGSGWNVTLTSTTFTSGGFTLANTSVTDTGASGACDASVTCTLGTNAISYPMTVPAGASAPTAIKIQSAAAATGQSGQTWTHTMNLAVPANVHAATYTSTWTYSLASAP